MVLDLDYRIIYSLARVGQNGLFSQKMAIKLYKFKMRTLNLHIAATLLHTLSAILLSFAGFEHTETAHLTYDIYTRTDCNSFNITRTNSFMPWLHPTQLMVLNEILTAVAHAVGIAIYLSSAEENKSRYDSLRRWTEYTFTAFVVEAAILGAVGQTDIAVMIMVFVLNAVTQMMGRVIDVHMFEKEKVHMAYFIVPIVAFLAIVGEVITSAAHSSPIPITGVVALYAVLYTIFAIHQTLVYMQYDGRISFYTFNTDDVYILLSMTTKVVLAWNLVARLHVGFEDMGIHQSDGVAWSVFEWVFPIVALLAAAAGMVMLRPNSGGIMPSNVNTAPEASEFKIINF